MSSRQDPYGLAFDRALPADELEQDTIIVLDGHVLEQTEVPDDPGRIRLVMTPALGPPPGRRPDQREIVVIAPRDMMFTTARPQNIELARAPRPASRRSP